MAGGKSEYLEKILLDFVMGGSAYTPPGTVYIALSTAAWDDSKTGANIVEPSGGAYARLAVPNNATNWPAATTTAGAPSRKANGQTLTFATPSAGWGTILSAYVCDAASGGNHLWGADLQSPRVVSSGDAVGFSPGTLVWTED